MSPSLSHLGDPELGLAPEVVEEIRLSRSSESSLHTDPFVEKWLADKLENPTLRVHPVPLAEMEGWEIDRRGDIRHRSGRFFSITGASVVHRTLCGELAWDQPVIDQPEVGVLGILVKKIGGVLHFCLQCKEEPGNINLVQLSPTVQATFSNYTGVHGGATPPFVERFLFPKSAMVFAKLQTEDGGRFLFKCNRNMVVRVEEDELSELPPGFIWLTLRQIASLLQRDNLVHATTRSILSSLVFPAETEPFSLATLRESVQWLDDQKAAHHILVRREGLDTLTEWGMDRDGYFSHREGRFFRVIGISVRSAGREVQRWHQPILHNPEQGIIGLLMKLHQGERWFLMQAKAELGNAAAVQLGPTVQFTPGNYLGNKKLPKPFLFDEFSAESGLYELHRSLQAEEGARFFLESHRHRILLLPQGRELSHPPEFRWIRERELRFFLHLGQTVNSCARSVIATLL